MKVLVDVGGGHQVRARLLSVHLLLRGRWLFHLIIPQLPVIPFVARLYISHASF